ILPDPEKYVASILASVRAGEIASVEVPGANNRILRVVRHPIEAAGWVATFEDITEQRDAEQERDRNRALLDLIINNVPSAIFVKRAEDRRYVLVNGAGERFWGISRDAMIGKPAGEVFPAEEASRIEVRGNELLRSSQGAQRIRGCLNEGDLIARLGGDEFAVVRTGLQHPKEAEALAQQLRETVAGHVYNLMG